MDKPEFDLEKRFEQYLRHMRLPSDITPDEIQVAKTVFMMGSFVMMDMLLRWIHRYPEEEQRAIVENMRKQMGKFFLAKNVNENPN